MQTSKKTALLYLREKRLKRSENIVLPIGENILCILPIESAYRNCEKWWFFRGIQAAMSPFFLRTAFDKNFFVEGSAKKKRAHKILYSSKKAHFFAFFAVSERWECGTNSLMDFFFSHCIRYFFVWPNTVRRKKGQNRYTI